MTLLFDTAIVKEGGAEPVIESLNITPTAQQQVIEAPSGVDGYSPITVAAAAEPVIESLSVTPTASQQIIEAPEGIDGYSPITVAAIPQDDEPELCYKYSSGDLALGAIVFSEKILKEAYGATIESLEIDAEYTILSRAVSVSQDDPGVIVFNEGIAKLTVGIISYNTTGDVRDWCNWEIDPNRFDHPSKLYFNLSPYNGHGYLDISSSLPAATPDYMWSCDVTYDNNGYAILTNFQRIGE